MAAGMKRKLTAREDVWGDGMAPQDTERHQQLRQCLFYATVDKLRKECVEKRPNLHRQVLISNTLHRIQEEMYLEKSLLPFLKPPAVTRPPPGQPEVTPPALARPAGSTFREVMSRCKMVSRPLKGLGDMETAFAASNDTSASSAVATILEEMELMLDEGGSQVLLADPMPAVEEDELVQLFGAGSSQSCLQPDAGESHRLEITGSGCNAEELRQGSPGDATATLRLTTPLWPALPQAELLLVSTEFAKPADSFFGSFDILDSRDDLFPDIDASGFESLVAEAPSSGPPALAAGEPTAPCNAAVLPQHGRDWHDLDHIMELLVGS
ncbi:SERTA domain-containing protein 2-like isoform X2 [Emydura macquarii macquarii]